MIKRGKWQKQQLNIAAKEIPIELVRKDQLE